MKKQIAKKFQNYTNLIELTTEDTAKVFDDVINLSIGDPDITTPKPILDAMYQDALNGYTHYTDTHGILELREAIVSDTKKDFDIDISTDEVIISTSGTHAMFCIMNAIIDPGDEVIIFDPFFYPYQDQVSFCGGKVVTIPTYSANNHGIDYELLEEKINEKTKAIVINTPRNPTGSTYSKADLEQLADIVLKHDILLIADDIYTIFHFDGEFYPALKIKRLFNNLITVRSFSKDFCMTGFRLGYVIANKEIIDTINLLNDMTVYSPPILSQRAALYAIAHKEELQPSIRNLFKERIDYAYHRAKKIPFIDVDYPGGGIYLYIKIKDQMSSKDFCDMLYDKYHIIVLPGNIFGRGGEGYARIAVTVDIDVLKDAFDRLEKK